MKVVSDSGLIIGYARANLLHLFEALFDEVLIPQEVRDEILAGGSRPGSHEVQHLRWIRTVPTSNRKTLEACRSSLGLGESAAIALAEELNLPLLLEDGRARKLVTHYGVPVVIGSKTIVEMALESQLIPSGTEVLKGLTNQGYRIAPALIGEILRQVGEG